MQLCPPGADKQVMTAGITSYSIVCARAHQTDRLHMQSDCCTGKPASYQELESSLPACLPVDTYSSYSYSAAASLSAQDICSSTTWCSTCISGEQPSTCKGSALTVECQCSNNRQQAPRQSQLVNAPAGALPAWMLGHEHHARPPWCLRLLFLVTRRGKSAHAQRFKHCTMCIAVHSIILCRL